MKPRVANQKTAAMTFTEVLVVICMITVLAVVIMPVVIPDRPRKATRIQCLNNLKQIGLAYRIWADDHNGHFPMQLSTTNGGTMELTADGKNPWLNFFIMSNELYTTKLLVCPADERRVAAIDFTYGLSANNISYFVGMDADTNHPQMLLSGDDNFAIGSVPVISGLLELSTNAPSTWATGRHINGGNIGFADGSVQRLNNSDVTNLLLQTGVATNRLAIP